MRVEVGHDKLRVRTGALWWFLRENIVAVWRWSSGIYLYGGNYRGQGFHGLAREVAKSNRVDPGDGKQDGMNGPREKEEALGKGRLIGIRADIATPSASGGACQQVEPEPGGQERGQCWR